MDLHHRSIVVTATTTATTPTPIPQQQRARRHRSPSPPLSPKKSTSNVPPTSRSVPRCRLNRHRPDTPTPIRPVAFLKRRHDCDDETPAPTTHRHGRSSSIETTSCSSSSASSTCLSSMAGSSSSTSTTRDSWFAKSWIGHSNTNTHSYHAHGRRRGSSTSRGRGRGRRRSFSWTPTTTTTTNTHNTTATSSLSSVPGGGGVITTLFFPELMSIPESDHVESFGDEESMSNNCHYHHAPHSWPRRLSLVGRGRHHRDDPYNSQEDDY